VRVVGQSRVVCQSRFMGFIEVKLDGGSDFAGMVSPELRLWGYTPPIFVKSAEALENVWVAEGRF
jgi:hypothetical protein